MTLAPIAQPGTGVTMAAVPLNRHELIVVESRRKLGYDAGTFYEAPDTGAQDDGDTYTVTITRNN